MNIKYFLSSALPVVPRYIADVGTRWAPLPNNEVWGMNSGDTKQHYGTL